MQQRTMRFTGGNMNSSIMSKAAVLLTAVGVLAAPPSFVQSFAITSQAAVTTRRPVSSSLSSSRLFFMAPDKENNTYNSNGPTKEATILVGSPLRMASPRSSPSPETTPNNQDEQIETSSSSASPLIKLIASPLGALAVLSLIVLFHESGHYLVGKSLGLHPDEFSIGFGPKLAGFEGFGDAFNFRVLPMGGYVSFPFTSMLELPVEQRLLVLVAGVVFNLLLAFLIFTGQILFGPGLSKPKIEQGLLITGVVPNGPAQNVLKPGDVIVSVNGSSIQLSPQPTAPEAQRAITKLIETVQATPDGDFLELSVQRRSNNKQQSGSVTTDVRIQPQRVSEQSPPSVGVFIEPNLVGFVLLQSDSVPEAAFFAFRYVLSLTTETAAGFFTYASDLVSGKAASSEYRVSGPVGVIKRATEVVTTQDWNTVLSFAAALSINLSVINMLPIPPMDGFQIFMALFGELWSS